MPNEFRASSHGMRLPANAHDALFTDSSLRLGQIHWHLLKAATQMESLTTIDEVVEGTHFRTPKRTEFGKEVGQDEINWWIVKKETNLAELREQSECALEAVENWKTQSRELRKKYNPESYEQIVSAYRRFVDERSGDIATFHGYVHWLYHRDPLGPSILFTYRVWGSTKRGDRWIDLTADSIQGESADVIRRLTEIALGLAERGWLTYDRIAFEMEGDAWAANPEAEGPIEIDEDDVVRRTAWKSFSECADYFGEIRDSLRNIILDIDKHNEQRDVLTSDRFWRAFVEKALKVPLETRLWDFKETLTMWHAIGKAKQQAKITFVEDVASFANASGGVVIVGITDREPRQIVGVGNAPDVENRLKSCADAIADHLEYDRELVTIRTVQIGPERTARTCLAIIVAQAAETVGVRDTDGRYSYPVRRETGITRVSRHDVGGKVDRDGKHLKADNHDFLNRLIALVDQK